MSASERADECEMRSRNDGFTGLNVSEHKVTEVRSHEGTQPVATYEVARQSRRADRRRRRRRSGGWNYGEPAH